MWNEGYTAEVNYTSGYYQELSPERLRLCLLAAGIDHAVSDDPDYLELGFGQGLSLAIHAATNAGRYWGNDFNPAQVAGARELAAASGKPMALLEDSFEELARRDDLPYFDMITMHGIWSWISDASRAAIIRLVRERLKPGGVLFVSYNVSTGWGPLAPLRDVLAEYARREATGKLVDRINGSIDFADRLIAANAAYFTQTTGVKEHLERMKRHDRSYLAHEYYNAEWEPMSFPTVADQFGEAKLAWASSATIFDMLPGIGIPLAAHEVIESVTDPVMRELTRDCFSAQTFRRDIFIKGMRRMSIHDQAAAIERTRFTLMGDPAKCPAKLKMAHGEAELREDIYKPLAEALANAPQRTATVAQLVAACGQPRPIVWQALLVLTGMSYVTSTPPGTNRAAEDKASQGLNKLLLGRAETGAGVEYLAAPRIGRAVPVSRMEQMLMRAIKAGEKDPVEAVRQMFATIGQQLVINGEKVEDEERTREEIGKVYEALRGPRIEMLKSVGAW